MPQIKSDLLFTRFVTDLLASCDRDRLAFLLSQFVRGLEGMKRWLYAGHTTYARWTVKCETGRMRAFWEK